MLKLLVQLGGAASMVFIAYVTAANAIQEFKDEGKASKAWKDATTNEVSAEPPSIDRSSDRDNGAGVRNLRDDSAERGDDSRD